MSREDAQRIAARLIKQAKQGDLSAVKLLLDRIDGPQQGPLAVAIAQAQAATLHATKEGEIIPPPSTEQRVQIILVDTGRDRPQVPAATEITATAAAAETPQEQIEDESEDESGVMSAAEFLQQ